MSRSLEFPSIFSLWQADYWKQERIEQCPEDFELSFKWEICSEEAMFPASPFKLHQYLRGLIFLDAFMEIILDVLLCNFKKVGCAWHTLFSSCLWHGIHGRRCLDRGKSRTWGKCSHFKVNTELYLRSLGSLYKVFPSRQLCYAVGNHLLTAGHAVDEGVPLESS